MGGGGGSSQPKPDPWIPVPAGTNQNQHTNPNAILTPAIQYAQQYALQQIQGLPTTTQQGYPTPNQAQVQQFLSRLGVSPAGASALMAQYGLGQNGSKSGQGNGNGSN